MPEPGFITRVARAVKGYAILGGLVLGAIYIAGGYEGVKDKSRSAQRYIGRLTGTEVKPTHDRFLKYLGFAESRDWLTLELYRLETPFDGVGDFYDNPPRGSRVIMHTTSEQERIKRELIECRRSGKPIWIKRKSITPELDAQGAKSIAEKQDGRDVWWVDGKLIEVTCFKYGKEIPIGTVATRLPDNPLKSE